MLELLPGVSALFFISNPFVRTLAYLLLGGILGTAVGLLFTRLARIEDH